MQLSNWIRLICVKGLRIVWKEMKQRQGGKNAQGGTKEEHAWVFIIQKLWEFNWGGREYLSKTRDDLSGVRGYKGGRVSGVTKGEGFHLKLLMSGRATEEGSPYFTMPGLFRMLAECVKQARGPWFNGYLGPGPGSKVGSLYHSTPVSMTLTSWQT